MVSLARKPLGHGPELRPPIAGCDPFAPFCRQTVPPTFTLSFARGHGERADDAARVSADREPHHPARQGPHRRGTGAFVRARGSVEGGGFLEFTETGVEQRPLLRGAPEVMRNYLVELQLPSAGAAVDRRRRRSGARRPSRSLRARA
jgi:hypothetical protein